MLHSRYSKLCFNPRNQHRTPSYLAAHNRECCVAQQKVLKSPVCRPLIETNDFPTILYENETESISLSQVCCCQ